jgi:hypothetical protein
MKIPRPDARSKADPRAALGLDGDEGKAVTKAAARLSIQERSWHYPQ